MVTTNIMGKNNFVFYRLKSVFYFLVNQGLDSIPEAALGKMWSKKARMDDDFVVNLSEDNLTCNESIEASSVWENQVLPNPSLSTLGEFDGFSISDLENADLGTPPDFLTVRSTKNKKRILFTLKNHRY